MKSGAPQAIEIEVRNKPIANKSNADHKQNLLCETCELHIKQSYEDYGTVFLHKKKGAIESRENLIIPGFQYKKYYLFIVSILWRASISSLPIYATARNLQKIEPYLRSCIWENSIWITDRGPKLDDFIKISVARITDSTGQLGQASLDRMILSLSAERGSNEEDGIHFFFMADGFLITASIILPNSPLASSWKTPGRLIDRNHLKIPKICFTSIKPIFDAIAAIPKTKAI
jgi:hypothetical protein